MDLEFRLHVCFSEGVHNGFVGDLEGYYTENHALPSLSLSPWLVPRDGTVIEGKFCHSGRVTGKLYLTEDLLRVYSCKTGSAYISRYAVNARIARAAS